MPTESEKDGAPSLALSRLQLLGVGLTYSTQKHHKSRNKSWDYTDRQHENRVQNGITVTDDLMTANITNETHCGDIVYTTDQSTHFPK